MRARYELAFGGRPRFFGVNYSSTIRAGEKPLYTTVRVRLIRRSSATEVKMGEEHLIVDADDILGVMDD